MREKRHATRHTRRVFYLPRAVEGRLFSSLFVQEPFYGRLIVHERRSRIFLRWLRLSGSGVHKVKAPLHTFFLDGSCLGFFHLVEESFDFQNPSSRLVGRHQASILF